MGFIHMTLVLQFSFSEFNIATFKFHWPLLYTSTRNLAKAEWYTRSLSVLSITENSDTLWLCNRDIMPTIVILLANTNQWAYLYVFFYIEQCRLPYHLLYNDPLLTHMARRSVLCCCSWSPVKWVKFKSQVSISPDHIANCQLMTLYI